VLVTPTKPKQHEESGHADNLEKDETELRLEKALFGDEAGFLDALRSRDAEDGRSLQRRQRNEESESDGSEGEQDLANVADEDVSGRSHASSCR